MGLRHVRLYENVATGARIAITRSDPDTGSAGHFFLDFDRPLGMLRWCLARNERFGWIVALRVPVIHRDELIGGRFIEVGRDDPSFGDLQELWAAYHSGLAQEAAGHGNPSSFETDFRAHFPDG